MEITGIRRRLMPQRIRRILLVSSLYDQYILEEDGLISERVFNEYAHLHLSHPPEITQVSTAAQALEAIQSQPFDLVVTALHIGAMNAFALGREIKNLRPNLPVILLTSETGHLYWIQKMRDTSGVDRIFFWRGDAKLFLAIVKWHEDSLNIEHDIARGDVRLILLVEDHPDFYSSFLPLLYTEIMVQTRRLIEEGVSDEEKLFRMSARPKIILAGDYEQALATYDKYRGNILGIISDVHFPREGKLDPEAGLRFARYVRERDGDMPILLQSAEKAAAEVFAEAGVSHLDKSSPHLFHDIHSYVLEYYGFGDFIFRWPWGPEVARATNLRELEERLGDVPDESLEYHSNRNHFSNWLIARGEFELARRLRPVYVDDFENLAGLRRYLIESIAQAREERQRGEIADFSQKLFDLTQPFVRFGGGSIGGKARGIAFVSKLLTLPEVSQQFAGVKLLVPKTAVVGTDEYDRFLRDNDLYQFAASTAADQEIAERFLAGRLPPQLLQDLEFFLRRVNYPLAVRSSSLTEDSQSRPLAGLYCTYMLPNNHPDPAVRLQQLGQAIKLVYASPFYQHAKAYHAIHGLPIESEKMAVIIQQMIGQEHGGYYYPDFAGVAQSYNFFPVGPQKPEDGMVEVVLGLGTMAVHGERVLRFSPRHPGLIPEFHAAKDLLRASQQHFHGLDLSASAAALTRDEESTLRRMPISEAEEHGTLAAMGGVFDRGDQIVYDDLLRDGPRVVTFSRIRKGEFFPLASVVTRLLEVGFVGLGCPVEIEFAVNLKRATKEPPEMYFLQIRPMITNQGDEEVDLESVAAGDAVCLAGQALGNGAYQQITDVVYISPERFDLEQTMEIAREIGEVNGLLGAEQRPYFLLGPGRWGSVNRLLGVPVSWAQISWAKVIAEVSTDHLTVEPSQGTHFFHNITSSRIGYLSLDVSRKGKDFVDWEWLDAQPAAAEKQYVRHVRLAQPIVVFIDGRQRKGAVLKPGRGTGARQEG